MGRTRILGTIGTFGRFLSAIFRCFALAFFPYALFSDGKGRTCSIYSHPLYQYERPSLRYSHHRSARYHAQEDSAGVVCQTRTGPSLGRSQTLKDERMRDGVRGRGCGVL